jgi:cytochrome c peroxidase
MAEVIMCVLGQRCGHGRVLSGLLLAGLCGMTGCDAPAPTEPNLPEGVGRAEGRLAQQGGNHEWDRRLAGLIASLSPDGHGLAYFRLPRNAAQLKRIPQDPNNPLTPAKVRLGQLLFHETALAVGNVHSMGRETYSCASCHHAKGGFAANLPQGIGEGGQGFGAAGEGRVLSPLYDSDPHVPDVQPIRTPAVLNGAYQELMLWNGQFGGVGDNLGTEDRWVPGTPLESNGLGLHGLETQAHAGLGVHRLLDIESSRVADSPQYQRLFRLAFPDEPAPINRLNAALAIAAFERTIIASRAPFQRWLRGDKEAMTETEVRGAIVFFGKAGCVRCHTGPALNSMSFHALGMGDLDGAHDPGRVDLRPFGGDVPEETRKGRGGFTRDPNDDYAFKTPQLYNLADSPFYGHGASFSSVRQVIEYLNAAISENPRVPRERLSPYFRPLDLTPLEIDDLAAFLENALYDPGLERFVPRRLPSGNCTPANDAQARIDLGCSP